MWLQQFEQLVQVPSHVVQPYIISSLALLTIFHGMSIGLQFWMLSRVERPMMFGYRLINTLQLFHMESFNWERRPKSSKLVQGSELLVRVSITVVWQHLVLLTAMTNFANGWQGAVQHRWFMATLMIQSRLGRFFATSVGIRSFQVVFHANPFQVLAIVRNSMTVGPSVFLRCLEWVFT